MTSGFAFDVQAVCAGFVFALANANALILSGQATPRAGHRGRNLLPPDGLEGPRHLRPVR